MAMASPELPISPEEEMYFTRILSLRQEISLLQRLIASRQDDTDAVDYCWAANFDRSLLDIYHSNQGDAYPIVNLPDASYPLDDGPARPSQVSKRKFEEINNLEQCQLDGSTNNKNEQTALTSNGKGVEMSHLSAHDNLPGDVEAMCSLFSVVPPASCPINADIQALNLREMGRLQKFDAVVVDPPWDLIKTTDISQVTRGVELGYGVLNDEALKQLKIGEVVDNGFVFLWGINSKWELCFDLIKYWGFEYFTTMHWIKKSRKSGKIAKGHGFYLLHSKEFILVGKRGSPRMGGSFDTDILFAPRTMQSAKPDELYDLIERLFPNGCFLDIFARLTSLRCGWVSIGNQLDTLNEVERIQSAKQMLDHWVGTGHFPE